MITRCVLELWGCHCHVADPWRHTSSQISAVRSSFWSEHCENLEIVLMIHAHVEWAKTGWFYIPGEPLA